MIANSLTQVSPSVNALLSEQDYRNLFQAALKPSFIAAEPATLKRLGEWAYMRLYMPAKHWPDDMRRGWIAANKAHGNADASEYTVATGAKWSGDYSGVEPEENRDGWIGS